MQIKIEGKRDFSLGARTWQGTIPGQRNHCTACGSEVDDLFHGLEERNEAEFVISNRKPNKNSYHTLKWKGYYEVQELEDDFAECYCLTNTTSRLIKRAFTKKNERWKTLYVWIY